MPSLADWVRLKERLQSHFPFVVGSLETIKSSWKNKKEFPPGIGLVVGMNVVGTIPSWTIVTRVNGKVISKSDFESYANEMNCQLGQVVYASSEGTLPIGTLSLRHGDAKDNADKLDSSVFPHKCMFETPEYHSSTGKRTSKPLVRKEYVTGDELDLRTGFIKQTRKDLKKRPLQPENDDVDLKRLKIYETQNDELTAKIRHQQTAIQQLQAECSDLKAKLQATQDSSANIKRLELELEAMRTQKATVEEQLSSERTKCKSMEDTCHLQKRSLVNCRCNCWRTSGHC